jgi:hypothetical protein
LIMSAGRACRPLPAAWRSAQHVHPEKSPSDLWLLLFPFGPLLVTFTSGRPVLRRPRSTRSSAGAFWPMAASHPSSVLAPPSPWRRRQPCRRRRASPCARCRTGGDGLHQVLTDLAPVWAPSTARPSGSASTASSSPRPRRGPRTRRRRPRPCRRQHHHLERVELGRGARAWQGWWGREERVSSPLRGRGDTASTDIKNARRERAEGRAGEAARGGA